MLIDTSNLTLFLVAAIALTITPGPDTVFVIACSLGRGRTAGIVSALGVSTGIVVHILGAAIGLSTLLMTSATLFTLVKWVGAVYLIYLGVQVVLNRRSAFTKVIEQASLRKTYFQGILSSALNPKLALFFLAFLPQFVAPAQGNVVAQTIALGVLFVIIGTIWLISVALVTGTVRQWLQHRSNVLRWQPWITGSILIGLGIRLAVPESR